MSQKREARSKDKLGQHLKEKLMPCDTSRENDTVIDGGWLVHQINWGSTKSFQYVAEIYLNFVLSKARFRNTVVVFDEYASSPKDRDHLRRTTCSVGAINIIPEKFSPVSKVKFLSNPDNKSMSVKFLGDVLEENIYIKCLHARDDCDTLIIKTALEKVANNDIEIFAEDTDILVMLVHHSPKVRNALYFTTSSALYNIKEIYNQLTLLEQKRLLLIYSITCHFRRQQSENF